LGVPRRRRAGWRVERRGASGGQILTGGLWEKSRRNANPPFRHPRGAWGSIVRLLRPSFQWGDSFRTRILRPAQRGKGRRSLRCGLAGADFLMGSLRCFAHILDAQCCAISFIGQRKKKRAGLRRRGCKRSLRLRFVLLRRIRRRRRLQRGNAIWSRVVEEGRGAERGRVPWVETRERASERRRQRRTNQPISGRGGCSLAGAWP